MFGGIMTDTWIVATVVAVIAGVVGFFVVLRGAAFPAHAIPNGAFAGAAAAVLVGVNTFLGLGVFAALAAVVIAALGRRGRHDVATALALVVMLALGAAFLSHTTEYSAEVFSLLFGELLGVGSGAVVTVAVIALVCTVAVAVAFRPLLLSSAVPEVAEAGGVRNSRMQLLFLVILALATTMTVPVVGALLIFSLLIGPPAAARALSARPVAAMGLSVLLALAVMWAAIALSFATDWPVGFYVGTLSAAVYGGGRLWARTSSAAGARRPRQRPVGSAVSP